MIKKEEKPSNEKNVEEKPKAAKKISYEAVVLALIFLMVFTFTRFYTVIPKVGMNMDDMPGVEEMSDGEIKAMQAFLKFRRVKAEALPWGIPTVYGAELDVTFDEVQDSMDKMKGMGPTYGTDEEKITLEGLEGEELNRFIKIGHLIACEYCCGVETLVDEKGEAACGCAHSIVMRGLAAYLIKNHSDVMTDDQILDELKKWKKSFFPQQTLAATFDELKEAGDDDIDALLEEFPDFLPQMVGGC